MNGLDLLITSGTSFILIFAAEIGDKSQLVCMALAAKYRALPVMLGCILAFILLNTLAVLFGLSLAQWLPEIVISLGVTMLFAVFGILALRGEEEQQDEHAKIRSTSGIIWGTFLLITFAEFGDKTQLAVVALSSNYSAVAVWIGSTIALVSTSALGVWAGRTVLQRIPIGLLHKISGGIFIALAIYAAYQTVLYYYQ